MNVNTVILIGALTRDPELRYTPNGTPVVEYTVAGEESITKADGTSGDAVWYLRCVELGKGAEGTAEIFKAGQAVLVQGSVQEETWEKDGQKHSKLTVKQQKIAHVSRPESDLVQDQQGGFRLKNARNWVRLVGNIGKAPEIRHVPSGAAVVSPSIAVTESWKGRDGNWQEKTHWVQVELWEANAESLVKQAGKGSTLLVDGRLKNESWTDAEGNKRQKTIVAAEAFEIVERFSKAPKPQGQPVGVGKPQSSNSSQEDFPPQEEDLPF